MPKITPEDVTPERVSAAYDRLVGVEPCYGDFTMPPRKPGQPWRCCALTALACDPSQVDAPTIEEINTAIYAAGGASYEVLANATGLSDIWVDEFASGFDGSRYYGDPREGKSPAWQLGKACRLAIDPDLSIADASSITDDEEDDE